MPSSSRDNILTAISRLHFSKSGVHGLAGMAILTILPVELLRFAYTHEPSFLVAQAVFGCSLFLSFGLLHRQYRLRFQSMSKKKGMLTMWIRAVGLILAFSSLPLTWYSNPHVSKTANIYYSSIALCGSTAAIVAAVLDLQRGSIGRGTLTATVTTLGVLGVVPGLHMYYGHKAFAELLQSYPEIQKSMYAVMMVSSLCQAWDSFVLGLATSGRISYDTFHKMAIIDWAITFSGGVFFFLWRLWDIRMAIASYLFFFGCYLICIPIERWLMATTGMSPLKYKSKESKEEYWSILLVTLIVGGIVGKMAVGRS